MRNLIDGPTPLHLFEKPKEGTGATLLAELLIQIATGRAAGTMTEGKDEEEWRRRITAALKDHPAAVLIDNATLRLKSAHLAAAITSPLWTDRLIGSSEMLRLPVRCAWVATGNNPSVSDEIRRRAIRIRMDAKCVEPSQRTGFRHKDLPGWVKQNRSKLVWAVLTIVRAWLAAVTPGSSPGPSPLRQNTSSLGGSGSGGSKTAGPTTKQHNPQDNIQDDDEK